MFHPRGLEHLKTQIKNYSKLPSLGSDKNCVVRRFYSETIFTMCIFV